MSEKDDEEFPEEIVEEDDEKFFSRWCFEMVNGIFVALIMVVFLLTFVVRQVSVSGDSMNNTLQSGDRLFISSFMVNPSAGDIVIVSHGNEYSEPLIKRVIATEGQSLKINYDTGEVSVNGTVIDEPYIFGHTIELEDSPLEIPDVIPEGYVFVMGDNRENSLDSRSTIIGLIPISNIIGKAEIRIFPFSKFGTVYYNMER